MRRKYFAIFKKSGLGLTEALTMIIVVSSLAVPFGGVVYQMANKSAELEEQVLANQMAVSVMAKIHAYGAYNKMVDYTVPDVTSSRGATLTVNLQWFDVQRMGCLGNLNNKDLVLEPPKMAAYRIEIWRLQNDELDIPPATLTFITGVIFGEVVDPNIDMIFAAVPEQKKIYAIDPLSHETITVLDVPENPIDIAVHPNGGWLAIKTPTKIYLMDVRPESATFGSSTLLFSSSPGSSICENNKATTDGNNNSRKDKGIVFRSDGKYLYWTMNSPSTIYIAKSPDNFPPPLHQLSPSWFVIPGVGGISGNQNSMDFELLQNGNIVWIVDDLSQDYILRLNTYTNTADIWASNSNQIPFLGDYTRPSNLSVINTIKNQRAVTSSWCGNEEIIYCYDSSSLKHNLACYLNFAPTHFWNGSLSTNNTTDLIEDEKLVNDLLISRNNRYIITASARGGNLKRIYAIARNEYNTSFSFDSTNYNKAVKPFYSECDKGIVYLCHSSYGKEIIADTTEETPALLFLNEASILNGDGSKIATWTPDAPVSGNKNVSAIACRVPEFAWIACLDGKIRCVDIYGMPEDSTATMGGKLVEEREIDLSEYGALYGLALTAAGDKIVAWNNEASPPILIDALEFPPARINFNIGSISSGVKTKAAAFTLDGSLIVGFESAIGTDQATPTQSISNGFLLYPASITGEISNSAEIGLTVPPRFKIKQIHPFHRRDGALILFRSETTPIESLIVWVEKSAAGGLEGPGAGPPEGIIGWRIMNYWITSYDGFPEGAPYKMAISRDDSLLALLDITDQVKVRIYDLQNQLYPMQDGLVMNRYNDVSDFDAPPVFSNLKNEMTRYCSRTPSQKINILNFNEGYREGRHVTRFFGYLYKPTSNFSLGFWVEDGCRFFIDNQKFDGNGTWWNANYSGFGVINNITNNASLFEVDVISGDYWRLIVNYINSNISTPNQKIESYPNSQLITSNFMGYDILWNVLPARFFRAFRFRPIYLGEIVYNYSLWLGDFNSNEDDIRLPNLSGGNEGWYDICFTRDVSNPTLILVDHMLTAAYDKLFGIGLLGASNWLYSGYVPNAASNSIVISPDGFRLLRLSKHDDDSLNKLLIMDISYPIPYNTPINLANVASIVIDLPAPAVSIAVRPFNSFKLRSNFYRYFNAQDIADALFPPRRDNNSCVLASGGIYIIGGSNGEDINISDKTYRFSVLYNEIYDSVIEDLDQPRNGAPVVFYDDKIFVFGGYNINSGVLATISVYDFSMKQWFNNTSSNYRYRTIQDNNNYNIRGDQFSACLSPYGILLGSGHATTNFHVYYPHALMNYSNSPPYEYGETLMLYNLEVNAMCDSVLVIHFDRADKKYYCYRVGGGSEQNNVASNSISKYDFDTNRWSSLVNLNSENTQLTERAKAGVCVKSEEIFYFGGAKSDGSVSRVAIAFNPKTQKFRVLQPVQDNFCCGMTAVACGPYIYLINGEDRRLGTQATTTIRIYTP